MTTCGKVSINARMHTITIISLQQNAHKKLAEFTGQFEFRHFSTHQISHDQLANPNWQKSTDNSELATDKLVYLVQKFQSCELPIVS